jgi:long-chain acyl-CoA synthetase
MRGVLQALAERAPDDVIIEEQGGSVTARQALIDIERLSATLTHAGIDRLGLVASNSAAWVITDLACQSAGICLLPLPVFFSDSQIHNSMQAVGLDAVLSDDPQRMLNIVTTAELMSGVDDTCGLSLLRITGEIQQELPPGTQKITFTSGSTGAPRGVCLDSDQQLCVAQAIQEILQLQAPRHLCLLPLSTLLENIGGVYSPLLAGGTVIVPPDTDTGFSGSTGLDMLSMLKAISRYRPTSIILLPQMLVGLVAALEEGWQPPAELKFAAVGGATVAAGLLRRAHELGLPVYEGYGLSETASVACLNYPGSNLIGSVGQPLPHVEVSIEADEVFVSGNCFLGYVGQPETWGQQKIATGDLGAQDADGYVYLYGRRSNVLISSFGRNISPEWVESELLLCPEISQCIVFGDDRPYCTALIAASDSTIDDARIQVQVEAINAGLPDYARIQRWHRLSAELDHAEGLYTENGRPKRAAIAEYFSPIIESLYVESAVESAAEQARALSQ